MGSFSKNHWNNAKCRIVIYQKVCVYKENDKYYLFQNHDIIQINSKDYVFIN